MDRYTAAVAQTVIRTNRESDNLREAERAVRAAAAAGARLVVLPEAFATGLNLPRSRALAEPYPGPVAGWLCDLARAAGIFLVGGFLERAGDAVYSSAALIDTGGRLVHLYRRVYVYDLERYFLAPGDECRVVDTDLGRVGLILGYDIQFPEVTRALFAQRVELLVCPAVLLKPFAPSIRQMALARAAENGCYVLFASAAGENTLAGLTFLGGSMILQSPVGLAPCSTTFRRQSPVLAEAADGGAVLTAGLDIRELRRTQGHNPLYKDLLSNPYTARFHGPSTLPEGHAS